MIETVYSNENGEIGKDNKTKPVFKMPKNIRQVGKSSTTRKIYVEDYVMTFIKQLSGEDNSKSKAAVLVGQSIKLEGCKNIFIYGAVEVEGIDTANEITFSDDTWTAVYDMIKKYFKETDIVGWFLGGPGYLFEDIERIQKAHIDNFSGQDKILLIYDNLEKEESFLINENGHLLKQEGYYIYYEKNDEMQTYMIDHKKLQSGEIGFEDHVAKEIRTVIQNKKPIKDEYRNANRLTYAAGALLAIVILIACTAMLNNYDQMKTMKKTISALSKKMEKVESAFMIDNENTIGNNFDETQAASSNGASKDSLNVEVKSGKVTPVADDRKQADDKELADDSMDSQDNDETIDTDIDHEDAPVSEDDAENKKDSKASKTDSNAAEKDNSASKENKEPVAVVKYYTVVSGDSLLGISMKLYNTVNKVAKIKELNNIANEDFIYIGQKLIVP